MQPDSQDLYLETLTERVRWRHLEVCFTCTETSVFYRRLLFLIGSRMAIGIQEICIV